jgi:hypothetical protein
MSAGTSVTIFRLNEAEGKGRQIHGSFSESKNRVWKLVSSNARGMLAEGLVVPTMCLLATI